MKLSIIIPIYNVINTLERCINSVLSQNFHDCEIILVDDGSTDGSALLCDNIVDNYKANDNSNDAESLSIYVVHQQNKGLSDARNEGLKIAKGQYVTFIDSDDYIAPNTYSALIDFINRNNEAYDMIEFPVMVFYGNKKKQHLLNFEETEYTDMLEYWLCGELYKHAYAWNKIYKRELFNGITYPSGKVFEDVYIIPKLLERCHRTVTIGKGLYYYCWNENGITSKATGRELTDLLEAHKEAFNNQLFSVINDQNATLNSKFSTELGEYYAHLLNIQLSVYEKTKSEPILPILPYYHTPKLKIMHLIGLKRLCKLNSILHKIYRRS